MLTYLKSRVRSLPPVNSHSALPLTFHAMLCLCPNQSISLLGAEARKLTHRYKSSVTNLIWSLTMIVPRFSDHLPLLFSMIISNSLHFPQIPNLPTSSITLNRWPCLLLHRENRSHHVETSPLPTIKPTKPHSPHPSDLLL